MPITDAQRTDRRRVIGSSDTPAICGVDPFTSALSVWASKVLPLEEIEGNEAIEIGNDFERPLLLWAAREMGVEIEENVTTRAPGGLPFASNHDALIVGRREGIEAKFREMYKWQEWGDPEDDDGSISDNIPPRVIMQCQHQCFTGGLDRVWVVVMLPVDGRVKRRLYKVERSETLISALVTRGLEFWNNHVLARVPPPAEFGEVEVFKRVIRETGVLARVPGALVEEWERRRATRLLDEKAEALALANLLACAGEADGWEWENPDREFYTYFKYKREGIDSKRLRAERPLIAEEFKKVSYYRSAYRTSAAKIARRKKKAGVA